MAQILALAVLALAACAGPVHAAPGAGPALGIFPPNATLVTATVMGQGTTTAVYLPSQPDIPAGATLHSLTIDVQTARQARGDLAVGPAAGVIEVVSPQPIAAGLVGRRIEAELTLVGTTRASRWMISHIRPLSE
jgi:hypothetical protein